MYYCRLPLALLKEKTGNVHLFLLLIIDSKRKLGMLVFIFYYIIMCQPSEVPIYLFIYYCVLGNLAYYLSSCLMYPFCSCSDM